MSLCPFNTKSFWSHNNIVLTKISQISWILWLVALVENASKILMLAPQRGKVDFLDKDAYVSSCCQRCLPSSSSFYILHISCLYL